MSPEVSRRYTRTRSLVNASRLEKETLFYAGPSKAVYTIACIRYGYVSDFDSGLSSHFPVFQFSTNVIELKIRFSQELLYVAVSSAKGPNYDESRRLLNYHLAQTPLRDLHKHKELVIWLGSQLEYGLREEIHESFRKDLTAPLIPRYWARSTYKMLFECVEHALVQKHTERCNSLSPEILARAHEGDPPGCLSFLDDFQAWVERLSP